MGIKNAAHDVDFESVEKVAKKHAKQIFHKKVIENGVLYFS